MPTVMDRGRVADFATWKPVLDEHGVARGANGACGERVFRSAVDPNEVLTIVKWDNVGHGFLQSNPPT